MSEVRAFSIGAVVTLFIWLLMVGGVALAFPAPPSCIR